MPAPSPIAVAPAYHRHRPEQTALYAIVAEHYPRFVRELETTGGQLPQFVRREFEDYLKCGLLEHGFLRVKCDGCRHEYLVAFSCKRRGFCPSCGARRMVKSAAHLVDHVFPEAPIRQWVLTFPIPLRFLFAARPEVLNNVLAVVQRGISTFIVRQAGLQVSSGARTGAVTLIQRFGSALNLNIHLHMLFVDGAYSFSGRGAAFHRARRPTDTELAQLLDTLCQRIVRVLERRGLLIADPVDPYLDLEPGSGLDQIQAASIAYRIAIGPHAGRKALVLYSLPPLEDTSSRPLVAQVAGFSLHAATVCEAWQRSRLERLCRYVTRPPIATKRLYVDDRGRVVYPYKHPFRDGSTHVLLEPLDFIARLAALVPRPRLNPVSSPGQALTRFHGIFAPNFKHRNRIVPQRTGGKIDAEQPTAPMSWPLPRILALRGTGTPVQWPLPRILALRGTGTPVQWMQRLKRVFAIDIETCPECGGKLRVIACIRLQGCRR
ncbi:MAG: transposase [Xanthomonadales bacterium]|nr:transposase [Xanthomonadales bacterium]